MALFRDNDRKLTYEDVFIYPRYSEVETRKDVDVSVRLKSKNSDLTIKLDVPIISANMDTVTEHEMAIKVHQAGGIGALHRFMSIDDNVKQFTKVRDAGASCFCSLGVHDLDQRADKLYMAGATNFLIDIAHGHTKMMANAIHQLRTKYGRNIFIMAGNVATVEGANFLYGHGADLIKCGIGQGIVCTTKDVTGVTVPMFSTVADIASSNPFIPIVADGGARAYGDVAKAIGAGALAVMSGFFFAGCEEVPESAKSFGMAGETFLYRGMASEGAMRKVRTDNIPVAEGKAMEVTAKGSASRVVSDIKGGLQSSYSYVGATNTKTFVTSVQFGRKV